MYGIHRDNIAPRRPPGTQSLLIRGHRRRFTLQGQLLNPLLMAGQRSVYLNIIATAGYMSSQFLIMTPLFKERRLLFTSQLCFLLFLCTRHKAKET